MRVIPGSFGHMLHEVKTSESNPPLYYVLAWGWARAFGRDEWGIRSLSALFGTLTVALGYPIGRQLASRRVGLILAGLLAFNPMLIWYSQEARSYSLLVFFGALSFLFFLRALDSGGRPRELALWALASALALGSHYFAFFAVGIEAVWLAVALRHRWKAVLPALAAVGAAGAALLPLIAAQTNPNHIGWIEESALGERFFQTGVSFLIGETGHVIAEPPRVHYAVLPAIGVGLAALALLALGTRRERRGGAIAPCRRPRRPRLGGRGGARRQGLRGRAQPAAGAGPARRGRRPRPRRLAGPPRRGAGRGGPLRLLARLRRLRHPDAQPAAARLPRRRDGPRPGPGAPRDRQLASSPATRCAGTSPTARCAGSAAAKRCGKSTWSASATSPSARLTSRPRSTWRRSCG